MESKGYRIYWPGKRSVTVERNVIFNENDIWNEDGVVPVPGPLSEGEMKLRKSSDTPKTQMTTLKSQISSTTMLKRTNQKMINNIRPFPYLFHKTQQRMTQRMNHLNQKVDLNTLRGTKGTTKG